MSNITLKDAVTITRDRLLKIPIPVAFVDSIGVELSACVANLTGILKAIEIAEEEAGKTDAV